LGTLDDSWKTYAKRFAYCLGNTANENDVFLTNDSFRKSVEKSIYKMLRLREAKQKI
jgi:hypothetical protein